jgi:hypothetical protein
MDQTDKGSNLDTCSTRQAFMIDANSSLTVAIEDGLGKNAGVISVANHGIREAQEMKEAERHESEDERDVVSMIRNI